MALLTASMSLRKTRANRIIGMSSESIASSIQGSSVFDLLLRRRPVEAHCQASHLGECVGSLLQGIDFPCLSRRQQASWLYAQRRGNNWRNRVAVIRISNGSQAERHGRNIIDALSFGPPPGSQQALQIGEAAGVAALLDVMKQIPSAAVPFLPALGKQRFQSTMAKWGSMLLAAYLAEP